VTPRRLIGEKTEVENFLTLYFKSIQLMGLYSICHSFFRFTSTIAGFKFGPNLDQTDLHDLQ
jgi:hypothetical protein